MSESGKIKRTMGWQYRLADLREDIRNLLRPGDRLFAAEVTSGDSGKRYWVQLCFPKDGKVMSVCQCSAGFFQWYPGVHGMKPCCKHAENLILFLKEKGKV
jgi:hypothetical protein